MVRHIFKLAQCGYRLRVTRQTLNSSTIDIYVFFYRPPGSPSKDSVFKRVKAEYSFNGKNPKELSVQQGDELMVCLRSQSLVTVGQ